MKWVMNLKNILQKYTSEFLDLKKSVSASLPNGLVHINLGNPSPRENVPLYLVMDFAVKGREMEYDYGLSLSVTFQQYDPEIGLAKHHTEDLYVMSDLTTGDGQYVTSFGPKKITAGINFSFSLNEAVEEISLYIKSQEPIILKALQNY